MTWLPESSVGMGDGNGCNPLILLLRGEKSLRRLGRRRSKGQAVAGEFREELISAEALADVVGPDSTADVAFQFFAGNFLQMGGLGEEE
jgi:hypothetical protein